MKLSMQLVIQRLLWKNCKGEITRLYDFVPPVDHLLLTFRNRQIEIIETNTPVDKGNSVVVYLI